MPFLYVTGGGEGRSRVRRRGGEREEGEKEKGKAGKAVSL